MARRKKSNQVKKSNIPLTPQYMEVSVEERSMIEQIKSPFRFKKLLSIFAIISGLVFVAIRYLTNVAGLISIYYEIFGYIGIVLGIYGLYFIHKQEKELKSFLKQDQFRVIWTYDKSEYNKIFELFKSKAEDPSKTMVLIMIILMITITLFIYFTLDFSTRFIAIPFGIVCIIMIILFNYYLPKTQITYAESSPYIILLDNTKAYALGQFITWKTATAKLLSPKESNTETSKFILSFEEITMFGSKEKELDILLPNNEDETIRIARAEAKRINHNTKDIEKNPEQNGDFLDRFFRKIVGRNNEDN